MVGEITKEKIYFNIFAAAAFLSTLIVLFVIVYVFLNGYQAIDIDFLTKMWSHQDIEEGGILPAILGTLLIAVGVSIISIPLGIATAIYLNEYSEQNRLTRLIQISIRNLAGVPSVVYGLFGLAFFVLFLKMGTSLIAASFTLSVMTLPWIITSCQEALRSVPHSFREGSYALGATKWQTIQRNVLPHSLSGMFTGAILGISRAIGETAPIIIVGATFFLSYLPTSPFDKFMALPYHLFILATQHSSPLAKEYAFGTALVLIGIIFTLNLGMFIIRNKLRRKREW